MGKKGDKMTPASMEAAKEFLNKIVGFGEITSKKMFGGHGIFHNGKMFGMVSSKGVCFLKSNEDSNEDFESRGGVRHSKMPYHSIPDEVLKNDELLQVWVDRSVKLIKR